MTDRARTPPGSFRAFWAWTLCLVALFPWPAGCAGRHAWPQVRTGTVVVDDAILDYRVMGRGAPLLMLTGYAMTKEMWDAGFLRDLAAAHRLILVDNRGMGPSPSGGADQVTIRRMALDAAAVLDALGIERADVLGWSMGGMIALELALARPDAVCSLVLLCSASEIGPLVPGLARMRAMSGEEIRRAMFPADWLEAHPQAGGRVVSRPRPPDAAVIRVQQSALGQWEGATERLGSLDAPVLLLAGGEDWVCPPEAGRIMYERLAVRTGAPVVLQVVGQGSHWMMHQFPGLLAGMANGFLSAWPCTGAE